MKVDSGNFFVDLGCGPGNISERLALNWPLAEILGIDGSIEMLKQARNRAKNLNKDLGQNHLTYLHSNILFVAKDFSFSNKLADVVVSNSLLHHIHNPQDLWASIKNISRKGSVQFHRDLKRPQSSEEALFILNKYLPNGPQILKQDYLASLHASFTIEEIRNQLDIAGLSCLEVFEVNERYVEIVGILDD